MSDEFDNERTPSSSPARNKGYKQNLGALAELSNHPQAQRHMAIRPRSGLALFRAIMADPMQHLTEELIDKLHDLVAAGNYPESAAVSLGIPQPVWKRWWETGQKLVMAIEDDPGIMKMMSDDEEMILMMTQAVITATMQCEQGAVAKIMAAGNFDWAACAWWLAKMHPEKWGRPREAPSASKQTGAITDNSGVLAVSAPQPVEDWLKNNQEKSLATLPE